MRTAPLDWSRSAESRWRESTDQSANESVDKSSELDSSTKDVEEHKLLESPNSYPVEPSDSLDQELVVLQDADHVDQMILEPSDHYNLSDPGAHGGHRESSEARSGSKNDLEESQQQDQWLWGSDVMITPIVVPRTTSRDVIIPEGSHWLCWKGCPAALDARERPDRCDQRLINVDQPLISAETLETYIPDGRQHAAGTHRPSKHPSIAAGGTSVHVSGVEIDLVPVWVRFGAILPMSSLYSVENNMEQPSMFSTASDTQETSTSSSFQNTDAGVDDLHWQADVGAPRTIDDEDDDGAMQMDGNGFQFQVATAEEALKAPVTLYVLLGDDEEQQGALTTRANLPSVLTCVVLLL